MDQFTASGFSKPTVESELVQCPYVPSHQVRPGHAMQRHLQKCRKNCLQDERCPWHEKAKKMSICQFNSSHHILNSKLKEHLEHCPEAIMVLKTPAEVMDTPEWLKMKPVQQNAASSGNNDEEEDWDNDDLVVAYDPKQKLADNPEILTIPYGKTPSERRQIRQEKRFMAQDRNN